MEAFEQFVALAMESDGFVVSSALKFPVKRQTRKAAHTEVQTHGFEVDLVGARSDRLVLASVKSFFGSRGVVADHVSGEDKIHAPKYAMLNDLTVRDAVVTAAAARFGYQVPQVELRLYVGKFAWPAHERGVRDWCAQQSVGAGPVVVVNALDVVEAVRHVASSKQYRDNPVLATLKVLEATGTL